MLPEIGQVVTVFRSRLIDGSRDSYHREAQRMDEQARAMPGYVEHKGFTADDGERVTVVTFADRASHDAWASQLDHRGAQRRGRREFYAEYSIQVGAVERASSFHRTEPS